MRLKKNIFLLFTITSFHIHSQSPDLVVISQQCGADSLGSIVTISGNGSNVSLRYSFDSINGRNPSSSLLQASNGKWYGTTTGGGINDLGVIYKFDLNTNTYTKLHDFSSSGGLFPNGDLIEVTPGKIYGVAQAGGKNNNGVIFSFNINTNIYTKLANFDTINASVPWDGLCKASNGKLYGLTPYGGTYNAGLIYSFDIANNTLTDIFDFGPFTGERPWGKLIQATDGNLYGLTEGGGLNNNGTLFSFDITTNTYSKVSDFYNNTGGNSQNTVLQAPTGKLYFNLQGGSSAGGTLIEYDLLFNSPNAVVNYSVTDGSFPGNLLLGSDGIIYGSTTWGGTGIGCSPNGCGTLYKYDYANSIFTSLYSFDTPKGCAVYRSISEYTLNAIGIDEIGDTKKNISFSPNPASSILNIKTNSKSNSDIEIINSLGQIVFKQKYSESIDVSKFAPGYYFIGINNSYNKFIKE
jgi:uncharacterized repeat protein (TIGR03803 family)